MKTLLEFRNLSKTYRNGERAAVSGINLEVKQGEILAFVGESGSGKTTLLRLAAGLEVPDEGAVFLNGEPVADADHWLPPEKRGVGLVFQGGALFPHLTVEKNVAYGLHKVPRRERAEIVGDMLSLVGLSAYGKRYPHELSGGERQRLALARARAPRPSIVLLDEPFSNLDRCLRCMLRDEVCRILREVGATSIFVTHEIDDALIAGDRVAVFRQGLLEQAGTPEELRRAPATDYCARLCCVGPVLGLHAPKELPPLESISASASARHVERPRKQPSGTH